MKRGWEDEGTTPCPDTKAQRLLVAVSALGRVIASF